MKITRCMVIGLRYFQKFFSKSYLLGCFQKFNLWKIARYMALIHGKIIVLLNIWLNSFYSYHFFWDMLALQKQLIAWVSCLTATCTLMLSCPWILFILSNIFLYIIIIIWGSIRLHGVSHCINWWLVMQQLLIKQ